MANNSTAYGFTSIEHLFSQRINDVPLETINTAIAASLVRHTEIINQMLSQLVTVLSGGDSYKIRYQLASSGSLQPLDEKGNPLVVKPSGFYDVGFPIQGAGHAWGDDRITRALMTIGDYNRFTWDAMDRDTDWVRRHIQAQLLGNTSWIYADPRHGDLTIMPLANGDAVIYGKTSGTASIDNHFFAQAAAIADATNPFPTLYRALSEHPSNTGPYVAYIASNLVASTSLLTALLEPRDTRVIYGSGLTVPVATLDYNVSDAGGPMVRFGDRYIGRAGGMEIVEWSSLPDNYIVAHASGVNDVLGMRQYEAPELQGLFAEENNVNGNLMEHRSLRFAGFGVMNRVAAAVAYVGVSGTYAVPAGYALPLIA